MSKSTSEIDTLYAEIHRRMIENGEWDRCLKADGRVIFYTEPKKTAEIWIRFPFRQFYRSCYPMRKVPISTRSFASATDFFHHPLASVPLSVKREITTLIKQFVKEQFEK
ncbi:hypothetical protein DFH29DRAFT_22493 [Suillus ampliporus]|nr:hypothetical protein DFH29DRAFT_22493 [Suillus ampliporus]